MADIDDKVAQARAGIAAAQQAAARAQHAHAAATATAEAVTEDLRTEFGVETPQQARDLIARLEGELAAECKRVTDALAAASAGDGTGDTGD